ncbi:GNAT family N-acetyltransferase [Nocardiopsis coralliicola]
MEPAEHLPAADLRLMQELAQRVAAVRLDLINSDASFGELAWYWGSRRTADGRHWRHRLWFAGGEPSAWAWVRLPREVRLDDGSVRRIDSAQLAYQVHPGAPGLVDEVASWYRDVAGHLQRTLLPCAGDAFALERWRAHGFRTDPAGVGDTGSWTRLNERTLEDRELAGLAEQEVLPRGYRFCTAEEAGPRAAVRAHADAWAPSPYTADSYRGVRSAPGYRGDLHLLVQAPDRTMAASTIVWFDPVNRSAEFEPVGTHPGYRRRGLARALILHGLRRAREAGAVHATVACLGAPGHPGARRLYEGVGFREVSRDLPLIAPAAE